MTNDLAKILTDLANQPPRRTKKQMQTIVYFTSKQKHNILWNALYGTDSKKQEFWWRLFMLVSWSTIPDLAKRLRIPPEQLERDYKLFIGEIK